MAMKLVRPWRFGYSFDSLKVHCYAEVIISRRNTCFFYGYLTSDKLVTVFYFIQNWCNIVNIWIKKHMSYFRTTSIVRDLLMHSHCSSHNSYWKDDHSGCGFKGGTYGLFSYHLIQMIDKNESLVCYWSYTFIKQILKMQHVTKHVSCHPILSRCSWFSACDV